MKMKYSKKKENYNWSYWFKRTSGGSEPGKLFIQIIYIYKEPIQESP
jgi:hypothetical protein